MAESIYRCPAHGYVTESERSDCGADAEQVLSGDRRRRLSKFLSGALRHFPDAVGACSDGPSFTFVREDDAGIELDDRGWADFDGLAAAATRKYGWTDPEHVEAVVETDPKGRFERDGGRIRAAYGHSVDMTLEREDGDVPDRLYHGTAPENVEAIRSDGLQPMSRQEVHLSETPAAAREVGRRHAPDPVVFEVDVRGMVEDDSRVTERGEGVYTADEVPPEYLGGL